MQTLFELIRLYWPLGFILLALAIYAVLVMPKRQDRLERWRDDGANGNPPGSDQ